MNYEGNSQVIAGLAIVGNTVVGLAKVLIPAVGLAMFLYGPGVLPWYKK